MLLHAWTTRDAAVPYRIITRGTSITLQESRRLML